MFTAYHTLKLDLNQQIARVQFSDPRQTTPELLQELDRLFQELELAPEIRSVIISGEGPHFLGGMTLATLQKLDTVAAQALLEYIQQLLGQIERCSKPVIMAVNGLATGFGMELALTGHVVLAAEAAQFNLPELSLGFLPLGGAIPRLVRLLGQKRALELILAGYPLPAADAYEWGLVNHVFGDQELAAKAQDMARLFNSNAPLAVRQALTSAVQGQGLPLAQALTLDLNLNAFCWGTADVQEGIQAALEQRPAIFRAR